MILSRLYLENFKQFRESVDLAPPEGAVGVVGANGSGKTTLFESILWAFFGSRGGGPRFANDSIPWSGGSTADRSVVEVGLDVGGASYTVFRSLHKGKTLATVRDAADEEVTSGPADVASWVQENILGMDRVAFESTFFARQKELEFFAGVEGVNRQREVARILGIDQVEKAQKLLRSDRSGLRAEESAIARMLSDKDPEALKSGLEGLRAEQETLEEGTTKLREGFEERAEALKRARVESARLEELYREHNRLSTELGRATSSRERAAEKVSELEGTLGDLDEDARKVGEIESQTLGLEEVSSGIEALEEARRRQGRRDDARKELKRLRLESNDSAVRAADLLERLDDGLDEEPIPGWYAVFESDDEVDEVDEVEQARAACRVLEAAPEAHRAAEEELRRMGETLRSHEELAKLEDRLRESERQLSGIGTEVEGLEVEIGGLTGGEELEGRIGGLRERSGDLRRDAAQRVARAETDEVEAEKLAKARRMVEDSDERAKCPTCQRGFAEDEHEEVIQSLRRQEDALTGRAEASRRESDRLEVEARSLVREVESLEGVRARVQRLREQRTAAASRREGLLKSRDEIVGEVEGLRERLSGAQAPSEEDLKSAGGRVERLRELREARPELLSLLNAHERSREAAAARETEVARLSRGEEYDPERHRRLVERRDRIQTLRGQLETLRSRISRRPEVESRLSGVRGGREEAAKEAARLEALVKELGFDEEEYLRLREASGASERALEEAREKRDASERDLGVVQNRVQSAGKELADYERQRALADEKGTEAASLGEMDSLLSQFYRELTSRVRPQLQNEAGELVRALTDGRYERMEFDENYGVRLYDGLADAYEISRFSGGEADIVSLCARVALSKMISGKGSGALGFIVLDEVFGALDSGRRQNVLLALDRLKRTFGQIFIISHVSDVQESALLDETWFVEEDEEGKSAIRRVAHDLAAPVEIPSV